MTVLVILAMITLLLGFALIRSYVVANKLAKCTWEELLSQLHPIEADGVTTVAMDHLAPGRAQLDLEPEMMWTLVGGIEGVQRMRENGRILIALAAYVERWNYQEGVVVAERMRRDGLQLRRAVTRIMLATFVGVERVRVPFYVHEAASSYYLMKQRLLMLYETNHAGLYPRLAEVL